MSKHSTESYKPKTYNIRYSKKSESFKIFADRETQKRIAQILGGKDCFVEARIAKTSRHQSFLEIDNRAYLLLQQSQEKFNLKVNGKSELPSEVEINNAVQREVEFSKILKGEIEHKGKRHHYDLRKRIWKKDAAGDVFCCKVHGKIYSTDNLEHLISLLKGEFLIRKNKDFTGITLNPLTGFGVLDSDKSLFKFKYDNGLKRKKDFHQLIKDVDRFRVIMDGADDLGHTFGTTPAIAAQTSAMIEGLLIFPIFLYGVSEGYKSMSDEIHDRRSEFAQKPIHLAELRGQLDNFRQELCRLSGVSYTETLDASPHDLMKQVAVKLREFKDNPDISQSEKDDKLNRITELTTQYHRLAEKEISAPKRKAIFYAYSGWLSMVGMMAALGAYEVQAIMNMTQGVEGVSFGEDPEDPTLLSNIGGYFGFGGQILMMLYCAHKIGEQGIELRKVKEKLHEFSKCKDVSELAKKISEEMMEGKKTFHQRQVIGHATLFTGQMLMAIGGIVGLKMEPLSYAGLAITLGSVAFNAVSELKYKRSYEIDQRRDEIETKILSRPPQFVMDDAASLRKSVIEHSQHQIFALELLGHLRAPQFVLYEKFIEKRQDDRSILAAGLGIVGGDRFMKWLRKPPQDSIKMVKNNSTLGRIADDKNNYDLDVFTVKESDVDFIWKISAELSKLHYLKKLPEAQRREQVASIIANVNEIRKGQYGEDIYKISFEHNGIDEIHASIIEIIQKDFIEKKAAQHREQGTNVEPIKDICKKVIAQGGDGALYLRTKLLRAVSNGDVTYNGGSVLDNVEIFKDDKKIAVAKLDIDKLNENELREFLTKTRPKKGIINRAVNEIGLGESLGLTKQSAFTKMREEELKKVKSSHLRPYQQIADLSSGTQNFLQGICDGEEADLLEERLGRSTKTLVKPESFHPAVQLAMLNNLDYMVAKGVDFERNREIHVAKQNDIIDKLSKQQNFILREEIQDDEELRTVFIYDDPDFVGDERYQIIFVRDDFDGEIDVYYGEKAHALTLEKAEDGRDGFAAEINAQHVEKYGAQDHGQYGSFKKITPALINEIANLRHLPSTVIEADADSTHSVIGEVVKETTIS